MKPLHQFGSSQPDNCTPFISKKMHHGARGREQRIAEYPNKLGGTGQLISSLTVVPEPALLCKTRGLTCTGSSQKVPFCAVIMGVSNPWVLAPDPSSSECGASCVFTERRVFTGRRGCSQEGEGVHRKERVFTGRRGCSQKGEGVHRKERVFTGRRGCSQEGEGVHRKERVFTGRRRCSQEGEGVHRIITIGDEARAVIQSASIHAHMQEHNDCATKEAWLGS